MSNGTKLAVQRRSIKGTGPVRRLRKEGLTPAVIYNDQGKSEAIQLNTHELGKILRRHVGEHLLFDLDIDGEARNALLKEVQHDSVDGSIQHADFIEVSMTKKMRVGVPIRLVGEPVGVSQQGGILEHLLRELAIECLPGDLVERIDIDVAGLALGSTLLVRDVKVDEKLSIVTAAEVAVATVIALKKEEEAPAEAGAAAAGEPEVITAKKEPAADAKEAKEEKKK